ncbi:unnamed protein product [Phytomonas sp. Hart1]|nr:unnamed protein product [Phytomonas sp. Hart1]|eukprot:CCW67457.1 unnamed protein product [Phytomonas sp. isolate Hart1]
MEAILDDSQPPVSTTNEPLKSPSKKNKKVNVSTAPSDILTNILILLQNLLPFPLQLKEKMCQTKTSKIGQPTTNVSSSYAWSFQTTSAVIAMRMVRSGPQ